MKKPILYNGYKISPDTHIINRVAFELGADIYMLSNGYYLYLFRNFEFEDIKNNRDNILIINSGGEEYPAIVEEKYSLSTLRRKQSELTEIRGLDCVAGMRELKNLLVSDVIQPLNNPEKYNKFKVSIPNGILLFGPPGCGKTFIVRKLAEELNYTFIEVKHSDIASSYIHGTVSKIGRIFDMARAKTPAIIFIDEIEGLVPKRDSLGEGSEYKQEEINELLMQLNDAGKQNLLVVAATNRPNLIDEAFLRSGRMDRRVYVPPPDREARIELFRLFLSGRPIADLDYGILADRTENYASVDLEFISNQTAREVIAADGDIIMQTDILRIISTTKSSITEEELMRYRHFINKQRGGVNSR